MVLVVDDEPLVAHMLVWALKEVGLAVQSTGSGAVAVEVYRSGGIELVVLDVQMPSPWDGPSTLAALRAVDPGVRAVFVSGHLGKYTSGELVNYGALRVFAKPFPSLTEWAEEIRAIILQTELPTSHSGKT